jgi:hypothetical protein
MIILLLLLVLLIGCQENPFKVEPPTPGDTVETYFPKFPHNTQKRVKREVMAFYSPDDIFSSMSLSGIGYPNEGFFKLHNNFPPIKTTIQIIANNRYLGGIATQNILDDPVAQQLWRDLHTKEEFTSWVEFGNHGYYHSPPHAVNLDHHEFNPAHEPLASDSSFCYQRLKLARDAYAQVGLNNHKISVMRFPGFAYTPAALQALEALDYLAFFSNRLYSGELQWINLNSGRCILDIPSFSMILLPEIQTLTQKAINDTLTLEQLRASVEYQAAFQACRAIVFNSLARGGVMNFFDHWWEHAYSQRNGINSNFEIFMDLLKDIEHTYGDAVWWGFGSELARWEHFKSFARVETHVVNDSISLTFFPPLKWYPEWKMEMSYTVDKWDIERASSIRLVQHDARKGRNSYFQLSTRDYWVEDNGKLHFNFVFEDSTTIVIVK